MPSILINIPKGAFPEDARANLVRHILNAAATAEQMPADPKKQFLSWIMIDEVETGLWTCGGIDVSSQMLTCFAIVHVPGGVLDDSARALYVKLIHEAFQLALPGNEKRQLATSVILHDVIDGTWGGNGMLMKLPDLARAAGFAHLQHLVSAA